MACSCRSLVCLSLPWKPLPVRDRSMSKFACAHSLCLRTSARKAASSFLGGIVKGPATKPAHGHDDAGQAVATLTRQARARTQRRLTSQCRSGAAQSETRVKTLPPKECPRQQTWLGTKATDNSRSSSSSGRAHHHHHHHHHQGLPSSGYGGGEGLRQS